EILADTIIEPKIGKKKKEKIIEKPKNYTTVYVNDNKVELKDKDKYVFIDLFEYIDFDLSKPQGLLVLLLNDNKAGYHDILNNGDKIAIRWE
ncbi:MAG: cell division protein FtsA, partial [Clostridiaceae bacterium]|nr:cell division protein FtsA [Clostridiaceae bacterium]